MPSKAQLEFLARHNAASVQDLSDPVRKLEYLEYADTDESNEAPTRPAYTEAQTVFLCGQSPDDLTDFQRTIFESMGSTPGPAEPTEPPKVTRPAGPPKLNTQKLADASLIPSARLNVAYAFDTVLKAHREALAGIDPSLRETRYDLEAAMMHVRPYLD